MKVQDLKKTKKTEEIKRRMILKKTKEEKEDKVKEIIKLKKNLNSINGSIMKLIIQ